MNTHADKTHEHKSQTVGNRVSREQGGAESVFQFVDKRAEAVVQRQLQERIDNSPQVRQLRIFQGAGQGVIQREFDAGIGAGWHIHYGEHIKYDTNNGTRVNFLGRTRKQIGPILEEKIQGQGLAGTKANQDFKDCMAWIKNNIAKE